MTEEEVKLLFMVDQVIGVEIKPVYFVLQGDCLQKPPSKMHLPQTGQLRKLAQTGPLGVQT